MADLLNGVPSIVIGIFAWALVVVPMHTSPRWPAGGAERHADSHRTARSTEQFLREVPCPEPCAKARWRWARANGR
jgi:phosphate transport system permease protein